MSCFLGNIFWKSPFDVSLENLSLSLSWEALLDIFLAQLQEGISLVKLSYIALGNISWEYLVEISLGKLSWKSLLGISLGNVSKYLLTFSLRTISWKALLESLEISLRNCFWKTQFVIYRGKLLSNLSLRNLFWKYFLEISLQKVSWESILETDLCELSWKFPFGISLG